MMNGTESSSFNGNDSHDGTVTDVFRIKITQFNALLGGTRNDRIEMNQIFSIGVDFGGTNLRVGSYAGEMELLDTIVLPTHLAEGRERVVRDMCEAIKALSMKDYGGRKLAGIGVGSPGPLQLPQGILHNPPNLPGWDNFDLRKALESALGQEVVLESDANAAALAEQKWGAGRTHDVDSLCMLTLGTGVGNGLILDGSIWHGVNGMGGEGGHIIVQDVDGAPCGCGGFGCLEQYASATAILRLAGEAMGLDSPASSHDVALLAERGDVQAFRVFEKVGHALAIALTGLINTLNLPLYTIGGGACEAWDLFAPVMFAELRKRSYVYRLTAPDELYPEKLEEQKTYILRAELGSNAGLLGACLLPLQANRDTARPAEHELVS
jgi:glucokinase